MWRKHSGVMYALIRNRRLNRFLSTVVHSVDKTSTRRSLLPICDSYRWQIERNESNYIRRLFSGSSEVGFFYLGEFFLFSFIRHF